MDQQSKHISNLSKAMKDEKCKDEFWGDLYLGTVECRIHNFEVFLYENDWYDVKDYGICIRYKLKAIDSFLVGRTELKSIPKKLSDKLLNKLVESALSDLKTETNERLQQHKRNIEKEQEKAIHIASFLEYIL